jgi:hypothetical protein
MTDTRLPTEVKKDNIENGNYDSHNLPTEEQMSAKQSSESYDRYNMPSEDEKKIVEDAKKKQSLTQKFKERVDNTIEGAKSYVNKKVENVESNLNKSLTKENYKKIGGNIIKNAGSNLKNDIGFLGNQVVSSAKNVGLSEKQSAKKYGDVQYPTLFGGEGGYADVVTKDRIKKRNIKQLGSFNQNENNEKLSKNIASIDIFKTKQNPVLDSLKKEAGGIQNKIGEVRSDANEEIKTLLKAQEASKRSYNRRISAASTEEEKDKLKSAKRNEKEFYEDQITSIREKKSNDIAGLNSFLDDAKRKVSEAPRGHNPMNIFGGGDKNQKIDTKPKTEKQKAREEKSRLAKQKRMGSLDNRMSPFKINLGNSEYKKVNPKSVGKVINPFGLNSGVRVVIPQMSMGMAMDPFASPIKKSHHKQIPGQPPQPDHPKKLQQQQSIVNMRDPFAPPIKKSHHKQIPGQQIKQNNTQPQNPNNTMSLIFGIKNTNNKLQKPKVNTNTINEIFGVKKSIKPKPLKGNKVKLTNKDNMSSIFSLGLFGRKKRLTK